MRIRVLSDLHHEHFGGRRPLPQAPADLVVLAGDIHTHDQGITWAGAAFSGTPVIYVPGNHEYYGAHMARLDRKMDDTARAAGIRLLQNQSWEYGGVRFLGTTLWADFALYGSPADEVAQAMALRVMPDFSCIDTDAGRFTPAACIALHRQARGWLAAQLDVPHAGPTVVVTHHAPSERSVAPQYKGNALSPAFSSQLDDLAAKADLWIHGHTHNCFDYRIGKARVVANPGGYPGENAEFDPALVIEI
ncbi:Calcineurin-like phosphoesterase superfamily domain protein [Pigmentiphaga humi]|uniref:Calcineurin-like phosphoesterase superfamily domain protein n=1 Tax=Pigmentiphaga humi TaxID=2478468 RepID=A0A3P4AYC4_9BURK|nr:metallophosphoesterase [Pigmentiphaga humi]VCU69079.1 Calcineurin-like phosphoesterase superfamily domain protein [Pigmentiphaga humi]